MRGEGCPCSGPTGAVTSYLVELARTRVPSEHRPQGAEVGGYGCALENLPQPGFCIDPRGVVICANPAATATLQLERSELLGEPFLERILPEDRASAKALLDRCRSEAGTAEEQLRVLRRDREALPLFATAGAIPNDEGGGVVLLVGEELPGAEAVGPSPTAANGRLRQQMEACRDSLARLSAACGRCREEMTWELTLAEDRERQQIAGGLHDQVGQGLASAQLKLGALAASLPDELAIRVTEIRELLQQTLEATRSLTFQISNPLLHQIGLEAALESFGQRLQADFELRPEFVSTVECAALPDKAKLILYRVLSELMFNAAKHASATTLRVAIGGNDNRLIASVEDDGIGIRAAAKTRPSSTGGLGLFLAEQRLAGLGGRLTIETERRRGTRIVVEVPMPRA